MYEKLIKELRAYRGTAFHGVALDAADALRDLEDMLVERGQEVYELRAELRDVSMLALKLAERPKVSEEPIQ